MDRRRLEAIALRVARHAWAPPETDAGDTETLLEYAGPIGPDDKIVEKDGKKYVLRKAPQQPAKPYEW